MKPCEKQFWRVLNASADTIIDLQLQYDGTPQPLEVVALDGVPTGSQDGTSRGKSFTETDILLAPAARAEFIVTGPSSSVQNATLMTLNVDTGPDGDNDPTRPIATIQASENAAEPPLSIPLPTEPPHKQRFAELDRERPTAERKLYFSEVLSDPTDPNSPTNFFITVDGQTPTLFSPDNPPAIVTTQGSVEDWTIENRSMENHEFHIHQIHFLLLEQNGVPSEQRAVSRHDPGTLLVGVGTVSECQGAHGFSGPVGRRFRLSLPHLGHEDNGMMAIIRVKSPHGEGGHR